MSKAKRNDNFNHWFQYKVCHLEFENASRKARRKFYIDDISLMLRNPQNFSSIVDQSDSSDLNLVKSKVNAVSESEYAEVLNKACATVFTIECSGVMPTSISYNISTISDVNVTRNAVLKLINHLNISS